MVLGGRAHRLANLLQERQLIRATRQEFEGGEAKPLPPIRFAGLIVEGGIIGYDANTVTGGAGANLLGVGGDTKYRRDEVTVAMRIVSVQSGEVLNSVTVTKTIYSVALNANAYRYVARRQAAPGRGGRHPERADPDGRPRGHRSRGVRDDHRGDPQEALALPGSGARDAAGRRVSRPRQADAARGPGPGVPAGPLVVKS